MLCCTMGAWVLLGANLTLLVIVCLSRLGYGLEGSSRSWLLVGLRTRRRAHRCGVRATIGWLAWGLD